MNVRHVRITLLAMTLAAACLPAARAADDGTTPLPQPFILEAPGFEQVGSRIRASGPAHIFSAGRSMTASVIEYDPATDKGTMQHVKFTTCEKESPDYHIEAREITLRGGNRITARRVSVFLGKVRLLSLPVMKLRLGGRPSTTQVFPRPSYDKDGGFMLAQKLQLADSDRLQATADLQLSTGQGVRLDAENRWGFAGRLGSFPGRFLTYESLQKSALTMPRSAAELAGALVYRKPTGIARLRQFGRFTINQRAYDVNDTALTVYRQPELGLEYIAPSLNFTGKPIDPRLEIYPVVTTSWGLYREFPSNISYATKSAIGVVGAANILPLGPWTAVQPLFEYNVSTYNTPNTYRTWGGGLDVSHLFPNGSMVTLRYASRQVSGATPFQFDNIDILREFQGAFQARIERHTIGFAIGSNLGDGVVYDWSMMYGYHTDCLAASVGWSQLQRHFAFDIVLLTR